MYKTHYDLQNNQWSVFKCDGGREEYICSYANLEDAQDYCDMQNGALVSIQSAS